MRVRLFNTIMSLKTVLGNMKLVNLDLSDVQKQQVKLLLGIDVHFEEVQFFRNTKFQCDAFIYTKHASLKTMSRIIRFKKRSLPGIYFTDGIFDFGNLELNNVGRYPWYTHTGFPPLADYILSMDLKYLKMLENNN